MAARGPMVQMVTLSARGALLHVRDRELVGLRAERGVLGVYSRERPQTTAAGGPTVYATALGDSVPRAEFVRCLGCKGIIAERSGSLHVVTGRLVIDCRHCKTANVFSERGQTRD